jgi:predicted thioesterase
VRAAGGVGADEHLLAGAAARAVSGELAQRVAEHELTAVQRRVLTFTVVARDDHAVVSRGTHRRAVIDRERFTDRLQARSGAAR